MRIDGTHRRTIWLGEDGWSVAIIDQTVLPHELRVVELRDLEAAAVAIETMQVRGAPLIGATAAYGMALAMREDPSDAGLERAHARLIRTRPTAVNLRWALERMAAAPAQPAARPAGGARLRRGGGDLRRGRGDLPGDRRARARTGARGRREEGAGCARQHPHPLQRRLARHHRLGHRHGPDLSGAGGGHPGPCLGRRDPAAQPGGLADRVRAPAPGGAAHRDRGQCRRAPDAARDGRPVHRRHRPDHPHRRRRQQDRHLPQGAGGPRQSRTLLRGAALDHDRLDPARRPGDPDRAARRGGGDRDPRPDGGWPAGSRCG